MIGGGVRVRIVGQEGESAGSFSGHESFPLRYGWPKKCVDAVVSSSLSDSYQQDKAPRLADVRDALYVAINRKLPRKLQIQDVLIQECLVCSCRAAVIAGG